MIIFTTFKEMTGVEFTAITSWRKVFPSAQIVIYGVSGLTNPLIRCCLVKARSNLPLVSDMFEQTLAIDDPGPFLFINGDIVITYTMREAAQLLTQISGWIATGQRREVPAGDCANVMDESWEEEMLVKHPDPPRLSTCGADWFLFDREGMRGSWIPPFAIARTSYDNWLIYDALERNRWVIDCSEGVIVYHQTHPEQEIRRSDDAKENFRLARESYPKWNARRGWINHANTTLEQLRERIV